MYIMFSFIPVYECPENKIIFSIASVVTKSFCDYLTRVRQVTSIAIVSCNATHLMVEKSLIGNFGINIKIRNFVNYKPTGILITFEDLSFKPILNLSF